nr:fructose-6-phosphate aldolase [Clostridium sp. Cult3]
MLILDTANLKDIKKAIEYYPVSGVTTNPTIITKEDGDYIQTFKKIRNLIGEDKALHVQILAEDAETMVEEGLYLIELLGENTYIKVPITREGIKAIKMLKEKNIKTTGTAIFTSMQALVAAEAGASFVAPYVNRIDNLQGDGVAVVEKIKILFEEHRLDTQILAASFKNVQQIQETLLVGAENVTIPFELLEKLIYCPSTDLSVDQFVQDWHNRFGTKNILRK